MDCRALPFHSLPHQPKLFLDYLGHYSRVRDFYTHPPTLQSAVKVARKLRFPPDRRREVVSILRDQNASLGGGEAAQQNLKLLEAGAVAVVSGQQAGLFTGPAYAIYKALTAIQVARELTRKGIPAVPVFWVASEDHDLDEVRRSTWFQNGKLLRFELPASPESGKPVGRIALGPEAEELSRVSAAILSESGSEPLAAMLRDCYRSGETYGNAFAKLFARLFSEQGLILLEPLDERLHRLAAPVYAKAIAGRDDLSDRLLQRDKALDKAGYEAQVKVTSRSTLLFRMGDGPRLPVTVNGGKFHCGESTWTREELEAAIAAEPEHFSPNALLRPVVQDFLLPTAAYIAGPAEIAYFAQAQAIYEPILGRMPVILPRSGFTLLDARTEKILRRYRLSVEDIWAGSQEVRRRMESVSVPKNLAAEFDRDAKLVSSALAKLHKKIVKLDSTLQGAVENSGRKMQFHLDKLRRKTGKAYDQKAGLIARHEEWLESLLYPHKALQSRELCFLPFLARLGPGGLAELQKLSFGKKGARHLLVRIP